MLKRITPPLLVLSIPLCFATSACDNENKPEQKAEAKAQSKADAEFEAALEKRREERLAKQKAEEEEKAALQAKIDEVAALPEKMPKNLDKACKAVADAQDAFMNRMYEGKAVEKWNSAKGTQLPMTKMQCTRLGSLKVAACQKHAFENASEELKKEVPQLQRACIDKFGPDKPPPGAGAPPKPPGG